MPSTRVQIASFALTRIGVNQALASLDEFSADGKPPSAEAQVCSLWLDTCIERTLEAYDWPFARRIKALALVDENPSDEWDFSYKYPSDCIAARRVLPDGGSRYGRDALDQQIPFVRGQSGDILTQQEQAYLQYTARVIDPTKFSPAFTSAVAWLLAHEIAPALSAKPELSDRCMQYYKASLTDSEAAAANESVGPPPDESEFVTARQ